MSELTETIDELHRYMDLYESSVGENSKLKARIAKLESFCAEFVFGEDDPVGYQTITDKNKQLYADLWSIIQHVSNKYDGETRIETAARYVSEHANRPSDETNMNLGEIPRMDMGANEFVDLEDES